MKQFLFSLAFLIPVLAYNGCSSHSEVVTSTTSTKEVLYQCIYHPKGYAINPIIKHCKKKQDCEIICKELEKQ